MTELEASLRGYAQHHPRARVSKLVLDAATEIAGLRNAHEALVEACNSAEAALRTAARELGGGYFSRAADDIRAALALAQPTSPRKEPT